MPKQGGGQGYGDESNEQKKEKQTDRQDGKADERREHACACRTEKIEKKKKKMFESRRREVRKRRPIKILTPSNGSSSYYIIRGLMPLFVAGVLGHAVSFAYQVVLVWLVIFMFLFTVFLVTTLSPPSCNVCHITVGVLQHCPQT